MGYKCMNYSEEVFTNFTFQTRLHIKNVEFDIRQLQVQILAVPLNDCVTLG